MKPRISLFHFLLFFLALDSCRPAPLDIDIQPNPPGLVVASQIIPSTAMAVLLTRSFSALENGTFVKGTGEVAPGFLEKLIVKGAFVTVSYVGVTDTLFPVDTIPGLYVSVNTLQIPYQTYSLKAYDPQSNESVEAQTQMLPAVKFDSIYPTAKSDTSVSLKLRFYDPPGHNWYLMNVYRAKTKIGAANLDINSVPFTVGKNQLLKSQLITDYVYNTALIEITAIIKGILPTDTIGVTFSNITEGHFLFLSAQNSSGDLFGQFFHEPVNIPTNVQNGYGYFNASDPDVKVIDLNQY